jgi:hypothetical protein
MKSAFNAIVLKEPVRGRLKRLNNLCLIAVSFHSDSRGMNQVRREAAFVKSSILEDSFELIRRYFAAFRELIRGISLSDSNLHDGRELMRRIDISIRVLTDVFPRSIDDGVAFVVDDIAENRRYATCKGVQK